MTGLCRRVFRRGAWAIAMLALGSEAHATPRFDSWTTENGLPQNSVNDILQTRDGYLWLATYGGLVRFDGVRFVVFDRSVEGIGSQRVRTLHEDRRGTLWAGTEDGMLIRYRDRRFSTYAAGTVCPRPRRTRIEEDAAGDRLDHVARRTSPAFDGERFQLRAGDFARPVADPPGHRSSVALWWRQDPAGFHASSEGEFARCLTASRMAPAGSPRTTDKRGNLWITRQRGLIRVAPEGSQR